MIRAVYRDGAIQPLDDLPTDWREGQELVIDALESDAVPESFEEWAAEINAAAAGISDEDHDQFMKVLEQIERESKQLGRREMERSQFILSDEPDSPSSREAG